MLVKYTSDLQIQSVLCLASCVLFIPGFFCATTICPPPDFPENGGYKPEKEEYEVGLSVTYFCKGKLPMYDENNVWRPSNVAATCQPNGKWSRRTPVCDIPTKIMSPSNANSKESIVTDDKPSSCFRTRNDTEEILNFSFHREALPYSIVLCFREGRGLFNISFPPNKQYFTYEAHNGNSTCVNYDICSVYQSKTGNITVQVSPGTNSLISLCGLEVFAKDDKWCENPPEKSVSNGQLQVSRNKAVLHCNRGFREKESRDIYATCYNNTWSYQSLQCVEGCLYNENCPDDEACIQGHCDTPCRPGTCGLDSLCRATNHQAGCTCPQNFKGNARVLCNPEPRIECQFDSDCAPHKICQNPHCIENKLQKYDKFVSKKRLKLQTIPWESLESCRKDLMLSSKQELYSRFEFKHPKGRKILRKNVQYEGTT